MAFAAKTGRFSAWLTIIFRAWSVLVKTRGVMCAVNWSVIAPMAARRKRRFPRKAFELVAALDVGDGAASTSCEVLDISSGGARLRPLMCAPKLVPDNFTLL